MKEKENLERDEGAYKRTKTPPPLTLVKRGAHTGRRRERP